MSFSLSLRRLPILKLGPVPRTRQRRGRKARFQSLEKRAMMAGDPYQDSLDAFNASVSDASVVYSAADASSIADWNATETTAWNQMLANDSTASNAFDATASSQQQILQNAIALANDDYATATNAADQAELAAGLAAGAVNDAALNVAQQALDNANNAADAIADATYAADLTTFNNAVGAADSQADGTVAAASAADDSAFTSASSAFDAAQNSATSTYSTTVAADQAAHDNTVSHLAATRDAIIGSAGAFYDPSLAAQDPAYQAIVDAATTTEVNTDSQLTSDYDQANTSAENGFAQALQNASDTLDQAVNTAQTAFDNATLTHQQTADGQAATAETNYATAMANDKADFDGRLLAASNQYDLDMQTASTDMATATQAADDSYNCNADLNQADYDGYVATRTTQLTNAVQQRTNQLTTQLQGFLTTYNNAISGDATADQNDAQQAIDNYNNSLAGFQTTLNNAVIAAGNTFAATMQPASQALQDAQDSYDQTMMQLYMDAMQPGGTFDQAAADAALAALNAAKHTYANTLAQAEQTQTIAIGAATNAFESSEEGAYVTEQKAIATADKTENLADADAAQTNDNDAADAEAGYNADLADLSAAFSKDVDAKYASFLQQVTSLQKTYAYAIATAVATFNVAAGAAEEREVDSVASAVEDYYNAAANEQRTLNNALAAVEQQLENDDAASGKIFADAVAAAVTIYENQIAAARSTADALEAAAQSIYENGEAAALVQWVTTVATAQANSIINAWAGSSAAITVAEAWRDYYIGAAQADAAQIAGDVSAWQSALTAINAAWLTEVQQVAAADETAQAQVTTADVTWVGQYETAMVARVGSDSNANVAWVASIASAQTVFVDAGAAANTTLINTMSSADRQQAESYADAASIWGQSIIPVSMSAADATIDAGTLLFKTANSEYNTYAHAVIQASRDRAGVLAPAAETATGKVADAHKTYEVDVTALNVTRANSDAGQHVADVAAEPDTDFVAMFPGAGDGFGNMGPEMLLAMAPEAAQPWKEGAGTYKKRFVDAITDPAIVSELNRTLPDGKAAWQYHHWIQQNPAVAQWVYSQKDKYLVQSLDNIRAVPADVHSEITSRQNAWWKAKADMLGTKNIAQTLATGKVTIAEYSKFVQELDGQYSKYWLTLGDATPSGLNRLLKNAGVQSADDLFGAVGKKSFAAGFHDRTKAFMKAAKIAIFSGALWEMMESVSLARGIAAPSIDQQIAFNNLLWKYRNALANQGNGELERQYMESLQTAVMQYLNAIGADDKTKALSFGLLEKRMSELP